MRIFNKVRRSAEEIDRIQHIREFFSVNKPTMDELVEFGDLKPDVFKKELIKLFQETPGALTKGDFTLASGKKAKYYIDAKKITLQSRGLSIISAMILDLLTEGAFDTIGGMTIGADPLVSGILALSSSNIKGFLVRKEPKQHGTHQYIEGNIMPGDRVVVIEDVCTTGGSLMKVVEHVRKAGCNVVGAVVVVDRFQGGAARFNHERIPFHSLINVVELGLEQCGREI